MDHVVLHHEVARNDVELRVLILKGGALLLEHMLLDFVEDSLRALDRVQLQTGSISQEADIFVGDHFYDRVYSVKRGFRETLAVVFEFTAVDSIKADFRPHLQHFSPVSELLGIRDCRSKQG